MWTPNNVQALKQMDGLSVSNGGAPAVDTISVAEKSLLQKVEFLCLNSAKGLLSLILQNLIVCWNSKFLLQVIRKSLVENKNDLEIQRKDPNCPLYSVKSFEELNLQPNLLKGVYAMGFNAPSKIQVLLPLQCIAGVKKCP